MDADSPFNGHEVVDAKAGSGSRTVFILFCSGCLQLRYAPGPMQCGKCQAPYESFENVRNTRTQSLGAFPS